MLILAKLIVLILCGFIQFNIFALNSVNIAIALIAMIIACLPTIINLDWLGTKGLKIIIGSIWSLFIFVALFVPELRSFLPLAIFDILEYRLNFSGFILFICLLMDFPDKILVLHIILCIVAAFLQINISKVDKLNNEIKKLRDTSKEREMLIEEKNRRLIESQDADIYAATLKERNRIAREIHDNVGHMLTRSILQIGAIKTINQNEVLKEPLEGLHETLNTAMTNIRTSVHDLHDESIDLHNAINEIIENIDDIKINLQYDMGYDIPKNIKYCFITIVKEAINNVLKHSDASNVDIIVQEHPAFYQLLIYDNGKSISKKVSEGIGLTNMRDRISALNGNIKITTDDGFKILISIIKTGV
ncbi:MAG: sensor histidine kinase [Lachnospiraceae bacterium]|nr:sensor histidine kinase [Lachnospiraceae bacterium]